MVVVNLGRYTRDVDYNTLKGYSAEALKSIIECSRKGSLVTFSFTHVLPTMIVWATQLNFLSQLSFGYKDSICLSGCLR